jgi:hypothetical protein
LTSNIRCARVSRAKNGEGLAGPAITNRKSLLRSRSSRERRRDSCLHGREVSPRPEIKNPQHKHYRMLPLAPNPGFVSCRAPHMSFGADHPMYQNASRETFLSDSYEIPYKGPASPCGLLAPRRGWYSPPQTQA